MKAQTIGPVLPSAEDMRIAQCAVAKLGTANVSGPPKLRVGDTDVVLPPCAVDAIEEILKHVAEGRAVLLATREFEVSTQRAADILNVSRPYLVELLESGKIPFRRVGTHRRIKLDDVLAYQTEMRARTARALDELTALSEEMGLYG